MAHDLEDSPDHVKRLQREELSRLKELADDRLSQVRPDRYEPGGDFLEDVQDWLIPKIPATLAQALLAKSLVMQQEGQATRRGNKFLKEICGASGQYALPLDWYLYAADPVALTVPVIDEQTGEPTGETRRERVALRAMTASDWRHFGTHGRVDAQIRYDAEMAMYAVADWLADQQGADDFSTWAASVAPPPAEATA